MKVIRFNLHQDFANYRIFYDFQQNQTYPLPPFSTVIGMLHTISNLKDYHPMKLFVTGTTASTTTDLRTQYEFSTRTNRPNKENPDPHYQFYHGHTGFTQGPKNIQLLADVNLTIYVQPESQNDFDAILNGLQNPVVYPALGRHEDEALISDVKVIDLNTIKLDQEYQSDPYVNVYMPLNYAQSHNIKIESGTKYKIHHHFGYQQINKNVTKRKFSDVKVAYTSQYHVNPGEEVLMDTENNQLVVLV